jgi:hypothetical protein
MNCEGVHAAGGLFGVLVGARISYAVARNRASHADREQYANLRFAIVSVCMRKFSNTHDARRCLKPDEADSWSERYWDLSALECKHMAVGTPPKRRFSSWLDEAIAQFETDEMIAGTSHLEGRRAVRSQADLFSPAFVGFVDQMLKRQKEPRQSRTEREATIYPALKTVTECKANAAFKELA